MDEASMPDILKPISQIYRKTQMYLNERINPLGLTSGQGPFHPAHLRAGKGGAALLLLLSGYGQKHGGKDAR